MTQQENKIAKAIEDSLISPNEADRNLEPANVVDGLFALARAIHEGSLRMTRALNNVASAIREQKAPLVDEEDKP